MYRKLMKNELIKNPGNNLILMLLMTISVAIAVSVFLILSQLFASITGLYQVANPPHFLQMHKGEINQQSVDLFNSEYKDLEHAQTVKMIDVYGSDLLVEGGQSFSLSDCRLDISLVKQNESYDVLLDENRNVIELNPGEIGVPVILLDQFDIKKGDIIRLRYGEQEKKFVVTEFVYDGQMNSTLCSSTRFLISNEDFVLLDGTAGETEYLLEAYFTDKSMASDYQSAYEQSELMLPKNGQAVTYPIIFLLSAMTDIMTAILLSFGGIMITLVSLLALRYTVLAAMEEEVREIGTMKAIGIPGAGIVNLYLFKVRILMIAGCMFGYLLAICFSQLLMEHMKRTFGKQTMGAQSFFTGILIALLMYVVVLLFTRAVLRKIKRSSIKELLILEHGFGKEYRVKSHMHQSKVIPVNFLIGCSEVRKGYGIIVLLVFFSTVLIEIPGQVTSTLQNDRFVTSMGSPLTDVMLEVEQGSDADERKESVGQMLEAEQESGKIKACSVIKTVRLQAVDTNGELQGIHVDTGDLAGDGLSYLTGGYPEKENEMALSALNAEELGKQTGDTIAVKAGEELMEFRVKGTYQDVTSGGKTAKTPYNFSQEAAEKYTFLVDLNENVDVEAQLEVWQKQLGKGYVVEDMKMFIGQTLGGVIDQLKNVQWLLFLLGMLVTAVITSLYRKLRMIREAEQLALKKALGIPKNAVVIQELYQIMIAGFTGIVAGIIFTGVLGDRIISTAFSALGTGLSKIESTGMPLFQAVGIPAGLSVILIVVTLLSCQERLKGKTRING